MKPIYSIKDRAIDTYGEPMAMPSQQQAVRWFKDIVNSDPGQSAIARHPDDYDLYFVGNYDEDTALLEPGKVYVVARGKDLVNSNGG